MKEDTLLRKLVADGEGVGDDRKVQQIATFFRESRKEDAKTSVPEAVKVTKALEFLELSMLKQKRISHMNKIHATECDQFAEEIDQSVRRGKHGNGEKKDILHHLSIKN